MLWVTTIHGKKFALIISTDNIPPVLGAIDYREPTGRWPVPAETALPVQPASSKE